MKQNERKSYYIIKFSLNYEQNKMTITRIMYKTKMVYKIQNDDIKGGKYKFKWVIKMRLRQFDFI